MHTTGSLYRYVHQQLQPLGESSGQQAYWLLEALLKIGRTEVVLDKPLFISQEQETVLHTAVERLLRHEPLQYVLGEAYFYGYAFHVSPAVLIPRPETEELVHHIVKRHKKNSPLRILDVCTGSGCIALTLAKELPQARIWATDISQEALAIAEENRKRLGVVAELVQVNALLEAFPLAELDVVVSNPPYVRLSEALLMQPNVLDWEPHLALFVPDEDALLFYKAIAEQARQSLKKGGWLYFEINEAYGPQVQSLMQSMGFINVAVLPDMQGKSRMAEGQLPA